MFTAARCAQHLERSTGSQAGQANTLVSKRPGLNGERARVSVEKLVVERWGEDKASGREQGGQGGREMESERERNCESERWCDNEAEKWHSRALKVPAAVQECKHTSARSRQRVWMEMEATISSAPAGPSEKAVGTHVFQELEGNEGKHSSSFQDLKRTKRNPAAQTNVKMPDLGEWMQHLIGGTSSRKSGNLEVMHVGQHKTLTFENPWQSFVNGSMQATRCSSVAIVSPSAFQLQSRRRIDGRRWFKE